jgi:hypothetical protein
MATERRLFDIQLELLSNELKSIDGAIRQHDEITKSIKNWAVVTWTGSLGVALSQEALRPFIWLTAVVPLVFWLVDGSFRRIQRSFIARIQEIAAYLNSPAFRSAAESGSALDIPTSCHARKDRQVQGHDIGCHAVPICLVPVRRVSRV